MTDAESRYLEDIAERVSRSWPASLPKAAVFAFGEIPLTQYLRGWAALDPDKPAMIYYGQATTFGEYDRATDGLATWLIKAGIGKGDRVAICLPTGPAYNIAFLGIIKAGAVVVPVNPLVREVELAHYTGDSGAKAIITTDDFVPLVRAAAPQIEPKRILTTTLAEFVPPEPHDYVPKGLVRRPGDHGLSELRDALLTIPARLPTPGWDDLAVINYTGGTTGIPKGCMHTHADLVLTGAAATTFVAPTDKNDVALCFLPTFWIAGEIGGVIAHLIIGATVVLMARWDAEAVMSMIDRYKVTAVTLLTDGAVEILDHPRRDDFDLTSLRHTTVASFVKVLNADYRARWRALTGAVLREGAWGMTETNTSDTFTTDQQDDDADLNADPIYCGLPVPGTQFKIMNFETGALMPPGEPGEIVVRTPSLLKGYWGAAATEDALRDGWLHTGDIGVISVGGHLQFRGRRKEMLKVNGMSVFPTEIETLLLRHPDIALCGVIGRPDERRGQIPVAFVRLVEDSILNAETLAEWAKETMAIYKLPEIRIVDSLPMTDTGKVKRQSLIALL